MYELHTTPEESLQDFEDYKTYEDNWDGYGSLGLSEETKKSCEIILHKLLELTDAPSLYLNTNGTLTFEWANSECHGYLEVGKTKYSMCIKDTTERKETVYLNGLVTALLHDPTIATNRLNTYLKKEATHNG